MASSKLWFSLLGCSITGTKLHKPRNLIISPFRITARFPSSLHFARNCSSSSSSAATILESETHQPWPEWVTFVDRLKSKGYFSNTDPIQNPIFYSDSKLLKDPCLSFARHRFDLLNSLSRLHIQTVVEKGCPNLFRKVVNSSKRLRAHIQLDEAEVCGACNLRGSCDRSYVILTDDEASARTVDIVRILLLYALDPSVLSEGKTSSDRIIIETSARRLLSELIELSDSVPAPEITSMPLRTQKTPAPRLKKEPLKVSGDENPQNLEMKSGDWNCSRCNFMNFARNIRCLKCKADGPKRIECSIEMKKGDWNCLGCAFMNFASKSSCFRCREPRPPRQLEPGEWECSSCNFLNYRRNTSCKKCNCDRPCSGDTFSDEEPPANKLQFGEWECPSCTYVNFRKNITCRKCNCDRPRSGSALS